MFHHGHSGEKTLEKKKKRGPARAYQFGNTIIVEDEDGEVIKKYETPPDRSKQSEKPAVSEKIRHRLARMGSYLGISYGETKAGSNEREVAGESSDGTITTKPLGQQQQIVTAHKKHPMQGEPADAARGKGLGEVHAAVFGGTSQKKGKIVWEFMARGNNEVTVDEGDEVIILDDAKSEEWWMVRRLINGKEGVVPANYVEITSYVASREDPGVLQARPHGIKNIQEDVANASTGRQVAIEEIEGGFKSDVFHGRLTHTASSRRIGKTVIEQIQQLDLKAHAKSIENSEVRELVRDNRPWNQPTRWPFSPSACSLSSANEENHNHLQQPPKDRTGDLGVKEGHFERDSLMEIRVLDQFEGMVSQKFDEDDILDTRHIPWDLFPDISRLRVLSKRHFDWGDGERFTADELDHVESLLVHTCRDLSCSRSLTDHQTRQITHLGRMARICLILDLIEQRQLLKDFIRLKIADDSLPLLLPILQDMLDPHEDGGLAAERFFAEQFRAVSRDWSNGAHHVMHRREALPFRLLRSIGFGSQGSIDEVQLPNTEGTCARKKWIAGANLQKITTRFDDEVKIMKKVAAHPHILELLASYTRGREFGLLLPVADCDLWHILTMNPSEREDIISNQSLIQSWGCLSSGLLFMHDKGIKHKDIKPQNIVLRRGDFQFTDFGLSKDISDLSHSATDGADRGTFKYMAPEVTEYQPQGRAADVFSLACVLFEIFSVWRGFSVDDADSFSALAPFH